ncbi:phosphoglycerate mutase-like protein [Amylocystis lapponica]|nr:phosphoglycerate mutase-like protein [Amylocystis lapponica]
MVVYSGRSLSLLLVLFAQVRSVLTDASATMGMGSSFMTSNDASSGGWKGHVPLDVQGYPAAPPELELQQVHIYARHGERTPVGVRMSEPPGSIPEHWMFCNTARAFRAAVASTNRSSRGAHLSAGQHGEGAEDVLPARRVVERADGTVELGQCLLGELTDVGRQSTYDLGHALRRLYVDRYVCPIRSRFSRLHKVVHFRSCRLGFLPDVVRSNEEIYLRSTNVPRTIESLQQIAHGLYPVSKSAEDFVPHLRIRNSREENLFGNTSVCRRLQVLLIAFAQAAATAWNDTLVPLDSKISKYIGGNPVRLDGQPRASGILDTVKAAAAHGVPVPPEFNEEGVIGLLESAVVHEWFADKDEEVRRLGMGPLLRDLSQKMQAKAERGEQDRLKILIHSAHDTSLAALCNTLQWPPFTASVTFELFRRREREDTSRATSPWQSVLTPFQSPDPLPSTVRRRSALPASPQPPSDARCRCPHAVPKQEHGVAALRRRGEALPGSPEFCTLAAFRERVLELTPVDWEAECASAGR